MAALAAALSPLRELASDDIPNFDQFLQKHYKEMTAASAREALEQDAGAWGLGSVVGEAPGEAGQDGPRQARSGTVGRLGRAAFC